MTTWQGPSWGTTVRLSVTDPSALRAARRLVLRTLHRAAGAAELRNPRAQVHRLDGAAGRPVRVGPLLASLLETGLVAAQRTGGLLDPTVGAAVVRHDGGRRHPAKDLSLFPGCGSLGAPGPRRPARPVHGWRTVHCADRVVTLPAGDLLDLTAVAKAAAAEHAARLVWRRLGTGVLVDLGGDLATAGPSPEQGWTGAESPHGGQDRDGVVGAGLRRSSGMARLHRDVIDPRTGAVAPRAWRSVAVPTGGAVASLVEAKAFAVAAAVLGHDAPSWLAARRIPAVLVAPDGSTLTARSMAAAG